MNISKRMHRRIATRTLLTFAPQGEAKAIARHNRLATTSATKPSAGTICGDICGQSGLVCVDSSRLGRLEGWRKNKEGRVGVRQHYLTRIFDPLLPSCPVMLAI